MTTIKPSKIYFILFILVLIWGLSWPVSKIALQNIPPLWLSALRLVIAAVTMFMITLFSGHLELPKRRDLHLVFTLSAFQIAFFVALINLGLLYVSAGRAGILAYTVPIWVTPIAVIFFDEKLPLLKLVGLILGLLGILILFNPWVFNWSDPKTLLGNGLLLLSAFSWTISVLIARFSRWHTSPIKLISWQLLIASVIVLILAIIFEPHPKINLTTSLITSVAYLSLLATAFGYWASITISKELPTIISSLALLGVPAFGLIFSALLLHESLTLSIVVSLCLVMIGVGCVIVSSRSKKELLPEMEL